MSEQFNKAPILHPGHTDSLLNGHQKPGDNGRSAVFTCAACGNKFVRTINGQSKCLACIEKETKDNR